MLTHPIELLDILIPQNDKTVYRTRKHKIPPSGSPAIPKPAPRKGITDCKVTNTGKLTSTFWLNICCDVFSKFLAVCKTNVLKLKNCY